MIIKVSAAASSTAIYYVQPVSWAHDYCAVCCGALHEAAIPTINCRGCTCELIVGFFGLPLHVSHSIFPEVFQLDYCTVQAAVWPHYPGLSWACQQSSGKTCKSGAILRQVLRSWFCFAFLLFEMRTVGRWEIKIDILSKKPGRFQNGVAACPSSSDPKCECWWGQCFLASYQGAFSPYVWIKGGILAKGTNRIKAHQNRNKTQAGGKEGMEEARKEVGETHIQHGFCWNQYRFWSCRTLAGGNIIAQECQCS